MCVCVISVYDKLAVLSLWTVVLSPPLLTRCSYSPYSGYVIDRAELRIATLWMELINWLADKRAEAYLKVNVSPLANLLVFLHGEIKAKATVAPVQQRTCSLLCCSLKCVNPCVWAPVLCLPECISVCVCVCLPTEYAGRVIMLKSVRSLLKH